MRFPPGFRALNHRDYRLFWAGQLVSLVGTWMQTVGQSWLILQITNSAFLLGLLSTLQFAPVLLLSLHAGAIVDRLPKRKVIIGTQSVMMVLAFVLAALVWTNRVQYWHVAVLAALLGLANTLDIPARQAFIVEMVGKDDLMNGIALNSAVFNGSRIIGPALAGLLVAHYGTATAFVINGVSFLAVIAALWNVRAEGLPRPRRDATMLQEIREGVNYSLRTPLIFLILALMLTLSVFAMNWNVLVPLLAKQVLNQGAGGFGLLMAVMGAGSLIGALFLATQSRGQPSIGSIMIPACIMCAGSIAMRFMTQFWSAAAMLFIMGLTMILVSASCNTLLQTTTPDRLRGRVMSIYALVFGGSTPIGSFLVGILTEAYGALSGFWVGGILGLLSVLGLLFWWTNQGSREPV